MACAFVQKSETRVRKLLVGKELRLSAVADGSILVTKCGYPLPLDIDMYMSMARGISELGDGDIPIS